MNAAQRRDSILDYLKNASGPVSATALAGMFSVSRQVIVGDIALLRAAGCGVSATPRGYVLDRPAGGLLRKLACVHTAEQMGEELNIMVDNGCTVVDVIVEHAVYGEITGALSLSSRYDVSEFLRKVAEAHAEPLSKLTGGVHLHTLRCPDEAAFGRVRARLAEEGFLYESNG